MHHHRDFVTVKAESSVDIRSDTPLHLFVDTTDLDISTDENYIIALFKECNNKVRFSVCMYRSSLHPFVSAFDTGPGLELVNGSFFCPS